MFTYDIKNLTFSKLDDLDKLYEDVFIRINNALAKLVNNYGGMSITLTDNEEFKFLYGLYEAATKKYSLIPYNEDIYIKQNNKYFSSLTFKEEKDTKTINNLQNVESLIPMLYD